MVKEIPLDKGYVTLVDDEDYEELSKYKWYYHYGYARRALYVGYDKEAKRGKFKGLYMQRIIANTPVGLVTDHINGNGLDNTRANLRICSKSQNSMNRLKQGNNTTSKYKGVSWFRRDKKWMAQICCAGKSYKLGLYSSQDAAALAYNEAAIRLHGEFAFLNEIDT